MSDTPAPPVVKPGESLPESALTYPYGESGLRQNGGFITEEFLRKLQGPQARRVYREMSDNDPTVRAILEVIKSLICNLEYDVQAADETPEGEEGKKFVEGILDDMETPIADVLSEACTMFPFGFAPMEITYKLRHGKTPEKRPLRSKFDDGKLGVRSIQLLGQNSLARWEFDRDTGELLGMWQQPTNKRALMGGSIFIHVDKMLLFRTESIKNNPEGRSLLRSIYRPWFFKTKIEEIEAVGIERDLAGLPMARIPSKYMDNPANSPEDRAIGQAYQRLVTQIRRDQNEGLVVPSDTYKDATGGSTGQRMFEIELLTSGGARTFNTTQIIDRWDRKIATAVLADFIFLGQQSVGSFALSSDKTALFAQALGAYVKRMAAVLNSLIERLWEINALDEKTRPKIKFGDLEQRDLNEIAGFLTAMSGAGAMLFPDQELENRLRKMAGLPERAADEEGAVMPSVGVPGQPPAPTKTKPQTAPIAKAWWDDEESVEYWSVG